MSYFVHHARSWRLKDEDTKEIREGITVTYTDPTTPHTEGEIGTPTLNITADLALMKSFEQGSGWYEFSFSQRRGKAGKPQLVLNGAKLLKPVKLIPTPSQ